MFPWYWVISVAVILIVAFASFTYGYQLAMRESRRPATHIEGSPSAPVGSAARMSYLIRKWVPIGISVEVYTVRDPAVEYGTIEVYIHERQPF